MLNSMNNQDLITYVPVSELKHIEGFSAKRVEWLVKKIEKEAVWTKPLCLDKEHFLVLDGQHRMESAKRLNLSFVPCILFDYYAVSLWSLRKNYHVDHDSVITRSLSEMIYPYKTVKHQFPIPLPKLSIPLDQLRQMHKINNKEQEEVLICG